MSYSNFHTHTLYCDGKDTPEELIIKAIELGCPAIGFSGHSYTAYDEEYCMSREDTVKYLDEIKVLKEKYADKIKIYAGIEYDYYSDEPTDSFDYIIGAVHAVFKDGEYIAADLSLEDLTFKINKHYDGDALAFAEDYYELVGNLYNKTKCDVIAHFDLLTKFNEITPLFDTKSERYRSAAMSALDKLKGAPVAFEINTGAISRGYRTTPYPEDFILEKIKKLGKKVIITSDCHAKENLLCGFDEYSKLCN